VGDFMINTTLRFLCVFALGAWVGSIFYFSAAVAPGAFRVLTQDQAGLVVEFTLWRLHVMGELCAAIFLVAAAGLALTSKGAGRTLLLPAIGVVLMLVLTLVSQRVVVRRMSDLRRQMVSVSATPPDNPLRAEFDRLHPVSVNLEGAVLLIGFVSLFLTARLK
jgi:uncharacterized membrane protein